MTTNSCSYGSSESPSVCVLFLADLCMILKIIWVTNHVVDVQLRKDAKGCFNPQPRADALGA